MVGFTLNIHFIDQINMNNILINSHVGRTAFFSEQKARKAKE